MLGEQSQVVISISPFAEAFLALIVVPLLLAVATAALAKRSRIVGSWNTVWAWMPVPAMAAVLIAVVGSQISPVVRDIDQLLPVIPVYIGFMFLAPVVGALASKAYKLPASTARAVTFSTSTLNSLVFLPLALALPAEIRELAAAVVITQTLVELVGELVCIRAVPILIWRKKSR
jgi:ACR3 family arsenite efflux pump ArsB